MFKNVLIAEDHQGTNFSIQHTLKELDIDGALYAYYCDDALLRLKHRSKDGEPFELLITDLSFEFDGREQKISDGTALVEAAKNLQPNLKVLVLSAESNPAVVSSLFQKSGIDGYVRKGRRDAVELKEAIESIYKNKKYVPAEFQQAIRSRNAYEFSNYDVMIIKQIANGTPQKNIPDHLQAQGARASSLSSIEKRLKEIREALGFIKNEQIIVYCKDRKII